MKPSKVMKKHVFNSLSEQRRYTQERKTAPAKKRKKEETPYCYYVCYQSLKGGQSQVSCSIIKRARPIDSEEEVGDLVRFLIQINQLQAVIPINWILLQPVSTDK